MVAVRTGVSGVSSEKLDSRKEKKKAQVMDIDEMEVCDNYFYR